MATAKVDRAEELKTLARRFAEYANRPSMSAQMRKDLQDGADIIWEYIVFVEDDADTEQEVAPQLHRAVLPQRPHDCPIAAKIWSRRIAGPYGSMHLVWIVSASHVLA